MYSTVIEIEDEDGSEREIIDKNIVRDDGSGGNTAYTSDGSCFSL